MTAGGDGSLDPTGVIDSAALAPPVRRALLIDDETSIRAALRRYFERRGWTVQEAEHGRAGLERILGTAAADLFEIIVSDLRMPVMSGVELHDRLALERPEALQRTIFVAGDMTSPDMAAFLKRTVRPVLQKPFELSALGTVVQEVLASVTNA